MIVCYGCKHESTEKHQSKRDKILNVHEKIKPINISDVIIGSSPRICVLDKYIVINDYMSYDKHLHIFDKNNFTYVTSFAQSGQGPGEIVRVGDINYNEKERLVYVTDLGNMQIFSYELDSIIANSDYMPKSKFKMNEKTFPMWNYYINDTFNIGIIIEHTEGAKFNEKIGKWNMNTGDITKMKYTHPDIKNKRILFNASLEYGLYAECYLYHDLMTICDLDGNLKYNIYGPNWTSEIIKGVSHFNLVSFCGDKIFALYSGEREIVSGSGLIKQLVNKPTKFIVFDIDGNYIKTVDTGYPIMFYCYDKENNRIVLALDDDMQFAYLNIDEIM
jgi:hypothetical protein